MSLSGASISDRSPQAETTNLGEERISVRRSLTDSLAVSSMLLLQPQQVSTQKKYCVIASDYKKKIKVLKL